MYSNLPRVELESRDEMSRALDLHKKYLGSRWGLSVQLGMRNL